MFETRLIPRTFARALSLGLALCVLCSCEKPQQERAPALTKLSDFSKDKKRDPKSDKNADKSAEEVRNDALEQLNKQLKNQEEQTKKMSAKSEKDAKKHEQERDKNPRTLRAISSNGAPIAEIEPGKRGKNAPTSIPVNNSSGGTGNFTELKAPNQKSGLTDTSGPNVKKVESKGSVNAGQKDGAFGETDLRVINGRGSAELGSEASDAAKKDPNFFQRLFGKKKPDNALRTASEGGQVELVNPNAKKNKIGQVYGEKPDGTQMGSMTKGSVLADETGKTTLKEIYNPTNQRSMPKLENFRASPADRSSLESDRIRNEMVRSRLESEAAMKKKQFGDGKPSGDPTPKNRSVTDFEPDPKTAGARSAQQNAPATVLNDERAPITADSAINAAAGAGAGAAIGVAASKAAASEKESTVPSTKTQSKPVQPNSASAPPPLSPTEEAIADAEVQLGSMEEYRRGLTSRDVVAREKSFQRAVLEKRDDALHALSEEVRSNALLAPRAARFLAAIGKVTPEVENALVTGLNSNAAKDNQLREMCADALGQLRIRRAVPLLIEKVKNDKSLHVRTACAAALGMIGDRSAIPTLQMKLDDRGEIEFVKQSAALALARFGDPSGRSHLLDSLDSQNPAYQILGLTGLAQLKDPACAAYLASFLDSRYPEVWTTAVALFPRLGAQNAIPLLREHLLSENETSRIRAALALGFLGCTDGVPLICRAARNGDLQERAMGCDLLGRLNRADQIPLLIEKLSDPHTNIRQTAACALAQMNATAATPYLAEGARGRMQNSQLPPALRANQQDIYERAVMLACLRVVRGEKDDLSLTLPSAHDSRWPEFDRELLKQQQDMLKMYKLVEVVPSGTGVPSALIQVPGGQEILYRKGETVAAAFKVVDINPGASAPDAKSKIPPFVSLMRGSERIILYEGKEAEMENVRDATRK